MIDTHSSKPEITLVNTFTVTPEKQQIAAEKVAHIYQTFVRHQPGFLSSQIQTSIDGTKVAAIAHWKSHDALLNMQQNAEFQNLIKILDGEIAHADPEVYVLMESIDK